MTNSVRQVRISASDQDGNGGTTLVTVPPGQARRFTQDFAFAVFPHCTFEVFDLNGKPASRTDIRAAMRWTADSEFAVLPAE